METQIKKKYLHEKVPMPDKNFLVNAFHHTREDCGMVMPIHWHENIEVIHVLSGEIKASCNESSVLAGAGDTIIVNSNEYHSYECTKAPMSLNCVVVDMYVLNSRFFDAVEIKYIQPILRGKVLFENFLTAKDVISYCIDEITNEFMQKKIGYELAVKANLFKLLVNLLRDHKSQVLTDTERTVRTNQYTKMNKAMQFIENNYAEKLTIDEMAEMTGLNKFYFCKLFKKLNGKTFSEYINYLRINEALNLFDETALSITDIAMAVGFNDMNYFSRVFVQITGIRPSKIRKYVEVNSRSKS